LKNAASFFRSFLRKLSQGKVEIVHFGWWSCFKGKYTLTLTWRVPDEIG
jgi:hypothetical protein